MRASVRTTVSGLPLQAVSRLLPREGGFGLCEASSWKATSAIAGIETMFA
jgi:hypothetical protein